MKIEDEIHSKFRNDYHKGIINLVYTQKYVFHEFLPFIKKWGISEPQYNILRIIRGAKKAVSIGYLKERMLDKNSDVSRIVNRLYERDLVERKENECDRRQKDISITDKALELMVVLDSAEQKLDALLVNLTLDEVKELNRLLDKIRNK